MLVIAILTSNLLSKVVKCVRKATPIYTLEADCCFRFYKQVAAQISSEKITFSGAYPAANPSEIEPALSVAAAGCVGRI